MKIALLTLDFPPSVGGVQQYLYELCRRIGRHHSLTAIVPGGNPEPFQEEPFHISPVSSSKPWHFARVLATLRPHLTIIGHAHPRLLLPAAILSRGRYITITYGNDFEAAQLRWHAPFFNRLLSGSNPLITISDANARRLRKLGLQKPQVILPGTDPNFFTPPSRPRAEPPILLTVSRLISRKGVDTVLKALPSLLNLTPDLQYWIVGDGPERSSLEQLAHNLQISENVRFFLGPFASEELPEFYRRASIYVMTTREEYEVGSVEGFGIVYLEASASGLPVVAARAGGAVEAVRDRETGLLVPPDDPSALAQTLTRLIRDGALRQRLGRAGRRWVEQEMNWDRAAGQFMSIIEARSR